MSVIETYRRDNEGYLIHPEDWDETVANELAKEEGLVINEDYLPIIRYMRDYWQEFQVAPDVRHVIQHLSESQGYNKREAKRKLFALFPYGYVKQACKIAGMKRPRGWSTG